MDYTTGDSALAAAKKLIAVNPQEREDGHCLYCDKWLIPADMSDEDAVDEYGTLPDERHAGDCVWLLLKKELAKELIEVNPREPEGGTCMYCDRFMSSDEDLYIPISIDYHAADCAWLLYKQTMVK